MAVIGREYHFIKVLWDAQIAVNGQYDMIYSECLARWSL